MTPKTHSSRCAASEPSSFKNPQETYPAIAAIFDKTFPMILIFGGLALSASIYRSFVRFGWFSDLLLHSGLYLAATLIYLFGKRFSVPLVFSLMLSLGYIIAIQSFFNLGLAGTGKVHIVTLCVFAVVFMGKKAGLITLILGALILTLAGAGIFPGNIPPKAQAAEYLVSSSNWALEISTYFLYLVPLILSVQGLHTRMAESLQKLEANNRQLDAEIFQREQAEKALRRSESRLRQVIDLVPLYIYARDREGRFILVNKATEKAF